MYSSDAAQQGNTKSLQSRMRIEDSEQRRLPSTESRTESMSDETHPLTQRESEHSVLSMDSTNDIRRLRRGGGHRPMSNFTVADCAQNFGFSDDSLTSGTSVETGLAVGYDEAAVLSISRTQDVLQLRRGPIGTSNLSRGANASSVDAGTGYNVDISVLASFHKSFSEEKRRLEPLNGERSSDNPSYRIHLGAHHGTGSEAETCSEIPPKLRGTESSSTENFSNFQGQGNAAQLDLLGPEVTLESGNVINLIPTNSMSNRPLPLNGLQPVNSINLINDLAAEYTQHHTLSGKTFDLVCSEDFISGSATSTNLAHQSCTPEEEVIIYNYHAQQSLWQDEFICFNQHPPCGQDNMSEVRQVLPDPKEHLPLKSRIDGVHGSCVTTLSDIDATTDSFSFWTDETLFYSCPPSPSLWRGSPSVRQLYESSYPYDTNTTQTPETVDSLHLTTATTAALEYIMKPDTATAAGGKHEVEAEPCDSSENWMESCGDPIYCMSRHEDAGPSRVHVDKSATICQGVSAEQETTEISKPFADSLELLQEQDKKQFGESAIACLQEHANDQLLHNSKRDRTNSIEMLSKPTSTLRKKKQKDEEIPEGRLRGTSICTDPNLNYGLAAVQNVLKEFHRRAGLRLEAKNLNNQRPQVADLLDAELEALSIEDSLGSEIKGAVFAILQTGCSCQRKAPDSDLVETILDLRTRLVSLLKESRSHERSTLSQLKDTVLRYSFLFPTSATDAFTKRLIQSNQYSELENDVCQYMRESKIFTRPSPSAGSSSSGRVGIEHSNGEASGPSTYPTVRGQIAIEALGEGSAGTPPPLVEMRVRTRITSRRDLSGARGNLPKVAAEFMRKWLFDNFDNPNPSRETKMLIANKFNITEKQVTNHFVNLRARKYRPLLKSLQEDQRLENVDNKQDPHGEDKDSSEITPSPRSRKLRMRVD